MKKTAAFYTLGCKVNSYETEAMRGMFEQAGYEIVDFKDKAQVYVINTCTVTNIADRKSRQMLHQAKKRNLEAVIVAVGCYVQASEEELLKDSAVDIIIGNNKKSGIVALVERFFENRVKEELISNMNIEHDYEELPMNSTLEKTRAFIKIQDGCDRFCSYCIIPFVRGRIRSRNEKEVLEEIKDLAAKGYKEVVLTGIHLSSYGLENLSEEEKQGKMPLAELIVKIGEIEGIERIRTGSLEPGIITGDFVKAIVKVPQFCPHFHLSLQSGSDTVLKRMNRRYTSQEYGDKVKLLREYYENPAFTTDIIVGFPEETQEEFEETMEFVRQIGFSQVHVFKYSKRAGTRAALMKDQISEDIKHQRSNLLISLTEKSAQVYKQQFVGRMEKVLIEENITVEGRNYQIGHTGRYLKLAVEDDADRINQSIPVQIVGNLTEEILLCEITH